VKRNDVLDGTLVGALGAGTAVCVLYLVLSSPRVRRRAGVDDPSDPISVPLVLAIVAVALKPQAVLDHAEPSVKRAVAPVLQAGGGAQRAETEVRP
jgi:STE24 endopeptidase